MPGFWAILLFVLAVSPVTAPFSAFDLENFLSDRDAHPNAIVQSKGVQDKSAAGLTSGFALEVVYTIMAAPLVRASAPAHARGEPQFPLRI